jgi:hypothetical protein
MTQRRSTWLSPQLSAVMARQSGLFTADQAYAAGHSVDEVQWLRRKRVIQSVRRGVYAEASAYTALEPTDRHRVDTRATLLRLDAPATLSHETAAVWMDLPLLQPDLRHVHVTRPEARVSRLEAGVHHHPGALPERDIGVVGGVSVTAPARTAVDIARHTDFARGLAATDSALRSGVARQELEEVMEYCSSWPGARGAGRTVTYADARAANPGESWSRAVLIEGGVPPTSLQVEVRDDMGLVGFSDFGWEEFRTLGEFDGRWKYAVPPGADPREAARVVWAEKRREDRLRAAGYTVVRWAWEDLFQPDRLVARVRAALERPSVARRTA